MTAYGDEDHDQARHIESEDWDKALEEFCRDAHWAEGALVLTPFQDGESASLLDPVFAITVGEHTEVVSAEWSYLLGRLDGGDDWLALHQQLRAASWWAALDGPQALVRLTVRVTQPVPANVRLLLPAEGHRHILDVPARHPRRPGPRRRDRAAALPQRRLAGGVDVGRRHAHPDAARAVRPVRLVADAAGHARLEIRPVGDRAPGARARPAGSPRMRGGGRGRAARRPSTGRAGARLTRCGPGRIKHRRYG
ncbi:hypothetical protein [Carbonactinospora thermoautotrophica]|uniref:hypothetical protein n=1 Tax=Carbonactinospora thermoautotrophica TaxID=1469144 RepID=UPI003DAA34A6